ncbi:MAG: hypothetical protein DHS20C09_18320 [marine bacterium B5-7]|nr:MAG: hypothetical protein DHS20C09_18320 [marine bacterium B5-7]
MKILAFHHVCIQTENYRKSFDFYVNGLGFDLVKETKGFHTRDFNTWLRAGDVMIELQTSKAGFKLIPWSKHNAGPVHIAVVVADVEQAHKSLIDLGYNQFKKKNGLEIYTVCESKIFKILAPEGTEIEVREDRKI